MIVSDHNPVGCLRAMRLARVHQSEQTVWAGSFAGVDGSRYFVEVDRLASSAAARVAARRAQLVYAGSAGRYLVTGPARWGTRGATTDQVDGEIASLDVLGVGACLSKGAES